MTPEGWREETLGSLAQTGDGLQTGPFGSQLHASDYTDDGVPVVMPKDLAGGRISTDTVARIPEHVAASLEKHRVIPGDILFGRRGDIGRCGVVVPDERGWICGTGCLRARLRHDLADPMFLIHSLGWEPSVKWLTENAVGQTMLNLNTSILDRLPLLVPPLPEQRKIAAILSSVDEAIDKTQAVIDQLAVVKKAMMQDLLTKGLPGRHTRFKQTEIGMVPEEWTTATYGELADEEVPGAIQSGPFGSELKHSEFVQEGKLVIGIDNVLDGRFSLGANHRVTTTKFQELRRFEARPLDLLITVMATVGRCCVVPENIEPAIITKHVYRLTVNRRRADPHFLMYCLYGIDRLSNEVRGSAQGLTRPGLNKSLLLPLRFPLPPIDEQRGIVAALERIDNRIEREARVLDGIRPVKSALTSVLLTGEVRVTPDEDAA